MTHICTGNDAAKILCDEQYREHACGSNVFVLNCFFVNKKGEIFNYHGFVLSIASFVKYNTECHVLSWLKLYRTCVNDIPPSASHTLSIISINITPWTMVDVM